jgi:cell division protein FtsW (lipid II flippase)
MTAPTLNLLPEPHTDFVFSTGVVLWGLVRWVAVVGVIAAIFFMRRWLRRLEGRGQPSDPPPERAGGNPKPD